MNDDCLNTAGILYACGQIGISLGVVRVEVAKGGEYQVIALFDDLRDAIAALPAIARDRRATVRTPVLFGAEIPKCDLPRGVFSAPDTAAPGTNHQGVYFWAKP